MSKFNNERVKGFLHTQGTKVVNGEGEEIILCGFGAGNWTNPEGFMVGAPTDIELLGGIFSPKYIPPRRMDRRRTFDQTIRELCGTHYASEFWGKWHRNHLGEDDIRAMAELGLNSVRLPINAEALLAEEPGMVWNEDSFLMLDDVIDWCEKYRIYAIIDLHGAPGGQSATACDGGYDNAPHLFMDDESWDRALAIWDRIAERYADRWIVGGYDLLNEPVSLPNHQQYVERLADFYESAIAVIRKHDKKHLFTLEGPKFSRSNEIFNREYDPECHNWLIHIHIYGASPEKKELYWYTLKGMELNVPVWIGEGGNYDVANAVFFEIAADYGIGYNLWCWKTALEKNSRFGHGTNSVGYNLPADWELVRGFAAGGPKPSYARSQAIYDELLENIKYKNCIHNKDYIRVTKRSPDIELPAVGYDNLPGDGHSYCGTWEHGNVLSYRLSDRTKLVLAPGVEEPRPGFDMYPDPNIQRPLNPLKSLMIELAGGEFAVYTVRDVQKPCRVSLELLSAAGATVNVSASTGETFSFAAKSDTLAWQDTLVIEPCEECKIKVTVRAGSARFKTVRFQY